MPALAFYLEACCLLTQLRNLQIGPFQSGGYDSRPKPFEKWQRLMSVES